MVILKYLSFNFEDEKKLKIQKNVFLIWSCFEPNWLKTRVIWTKNEVFGHVPKLHLLLSVKEMWLVVILILIII